MNHRIYGIPYALFRGSVSATSDASYVPVYGTGTGTNTNAGVGTGTTIHPRCRGAAVIEPRP
ncbi:MAG: tetrahydromethanopterin S-methyltransferase subunit D [Gammaproteobacteria bacterium]|jgi:tetrahydromethanopterin S-methyltransferase subunit D